MRRSALLPLVTLVVLIGPVRTATAARARLWVAHEAELVEYDSETFAPIGKVSLRQAAFRQPERLTVNAVGQVLEECSDTPWLWSGGAGGFISEEPSVPHLAPVAGLTLTKEAQWLLGADGGSVYRLENDLWERNHNRHGPADDRDSIWVHFHMERFDIATRMYTTVLAYDLEPCTCGTGVCSETCPIVTGWAPNGVVGNFFLLTDFISGQLGSSHGPEVVYRRNARGSFVAAESLEVSDDLDGDGRNWLDCTEDGACCGWSNESSEQVTFIRGDSSLVLYQEWPTYHNEAYDVSFSPVGGRISPDGSLAAFTIHMEGGPDETGQIRLNDDARSDTLALPAIRLSFDDMPMVEVHDARSRPTLLRRIRKAVSIGWLSERRLLLLLVDQTLVTMDVRSGAETRTGVRVDSRESVFIARE